MNKYRSRKQYPGTQKSAVLLYGDRKRRTRQQEHMLILAIRSSHHHGDERWAAVLETL